MVLKFFASEPATVNYFVDINQKPLFTALANYFVNINQKSLFTAGIFPSYHLFSAQSL